MSDSTNTVFRHSGGIQWFALVMDIPPKNLGFTGDGEISVVNLKCDTRLIGSFRKEPGIFPDWHMNKAHWLSVVLDGTVENEKIRFLVDMSYELTKNTFKLWLKSIYQFLEDLTMTNYPDIPTMR